MEVGKVHLTTLLSQRLQIQDGSFMESKSFAVLCKVACMPSSHKPKAPIVTDVVADGAESVKQNEEDAPATNVLGIELIAGLKLFSVVPAVKLNTILLKLLLGKERL